MAIEGPSAVETPTDRSTLDLPALRRRLQALERPAARFTVLPLGLPAIDDRLPAGGLARGALHEIVGPVRDAARFAFAATLAGRLAADGMVLWCRLARDSQETGGLYGYGLWPFGLPMARLLLVEAGKPTELLWAMEEGLRCAGVAAVLGEGVTVDLTASRRLQLAAEARGAVALLLPPPWMAPGSSATGDNPGSSADSGDKAVRHRPPASAATSRWQVRALPSAGDRADLAAPHWQVTLLRCRGAAGLPCCWDVAWDATAGALRLFSTP